MPDPKIAPLGEVEMVPIKELRESKLNARKIPDAAVEIVSRSLQEFGWQQPLVATADGELVVGHTRWRAAKKLGAARVPVVRTTGLTDDQVRAYRIADNRTGDYTSWDLPGLALEIESLSDGFADVLGLADWATILDDLDTATKRGGLGSEEINAAGGARGFHLVVTFPNEDAALQATEAIFDLGAIDVRHKRGS